MAFSNNKSVCKCVENRYALTFIFLLPLFPEKYAYGLKGCES